MKALAKSPINQICSKILSKILPNPFVHGRITYHSDKNTFLHMSKENLTKHQKKIIYLVVFLFISKNSLKQLIFKLIFFSVLKIILEYLTIDVMWTIRPSEKEIILSKNSVQNLSKINLLFLIKILLVMKSNLLFGEINLSQTINCRKNLIK
ncbi:hypothetical protein BpHYR1_012496 [Brachionus plicatilis]|uniref:Uncharacterized protein n=1 Tax=Brachionus plicatilis TaxID=10195 RepID=A0A3M7SWD7_BRAPC|nr:hypothetical protein BpHYR1_012496 [Brachionus plicatilis]